MFSMMQKQLDGSLLKRTGWALRASTVFIANDSQEQQGMSTSSTVHAGVGVSLSPLQAQSPVGEC